MIKSCGGCKHWIKVKNKRQFTGLCNVQDVLCKSDFVCNKWSGRKYNRGVIR